MSNRRVSLWAMIALLVLLAGSIAVSAIPDGYWQDTGEGDCPSDLVCAEWIWSGGGSEPCCIPPRHLNTSSYIECNSELRHLHVGPEE